MLVFRNFRSELGELLQWQSLFRKKANVVDSNSFSYKIGQQTKKQAGTLPDKTW